MIFLITTVMIIKLFQSIRISNFIRTKDILRQSIPMMLSSSVLLLMSWTDSLMIGSFINEYEVGLYNVAMRIAMITSLTLHAVNSIDVNICMFVICKCYISIVYIIYYLS